MKTSVIVTKKGELIDSFQSFGACCRYYNLSADKVMNCIIKGTTARTAFGNLCFDWNLSADDAACNKLEESYHTKSDKKRLVTREKNNEDLVLVIFDGDRSISYNSVSECSDDLGVPKETIIASIRTKKSVSLNEGRARFYWET